MVKVFLMACLSGVTALGAKAQDPVHFTYSTKNINGNQYELHVVATIDEGWHIYAQQQPKEAVSDPTKFVFVKSPLVVLRGKPSEIGKKDTYTDAIAGIKQYQYGEKVEFVQRFTRKTTARITLAGTITYQACTSERCLQPRTVGFSVPVE